METIVFAAIIVALAGGAIWFYNRGASGLDINQDGKVDSRDAREAVSKTAKGLAQDARDARDAVLAQAAESAARATAIIERNSQSKPAAGRSTKESPAKKPAAKKPVAEKKPAVRAKTAGTGRSRAKKST